MSYRTSTLQYGDSAWDALHHLTVVKSINFLLELLRALLLAFGSTLHQLSIAPDACFLSVNLSDPQKNVNIVLDLFEC